MYPNSRHPFYIRIREHANLYSYSSKNVVKSAIRTRFLAYPIRFPLGPSTCCSVWHHVHTRGTSSTCENSLRLPQPLHSFHPEPHFPRLMSNYWPYTSNSGSNTTNDVRTVLIASYSTHCLIEAGRPGGKNIAALYYQNTIIVPCVSINVVSYTMPERNRNGTCFRLCLERRWHDRGWCNRKSPPGSRVLRATIAES
jgi:hypothetical protein